VAAKRELPEHGWQPQVLCMYLPDMFAQGTLLPVPSVSPEDERTSRVLLPDACGEDLRPLLRCLHRLPPLGRVLWGTVAHRAHEGTQTRMSAPQQTRICAGKGYRDYSGQSIDELFRRRNERILDLLTFLKVELWWSKGRCARLSAFFLPVPGCSGADIPVCLCSTALLPPSSPQGTRRAPYSSGCLRYRPPVLLFLGIATFFLKMG